MPVKNYQSLVDQVKSIVNIETGIMDSTGIIVACTDVLKVGSFHPSFEKIMGFNEEFLRIDRVSYKKVYIKGKLDFIVYMESLDSNVSNYLSLVAMNLESLKNYFEDKFDKSTFIKNIIVDNILPGDVRLRANELHINYNAYRVVLLIRTEKVKEIYAFDIIQNLFPNKQKDFIIVIDDENIVLVKELKSPDDTKEIEKAAKSIIDTLNTKLMIQVYVGIGTVVDTLRDIGRSCKEAEMSLLIGSIFESEKHIIDYNRLGIGRLIYQLPTTLCRLFLKEVFKNEDFDSIDSETLLTIQKFFENNLNVSEASRQLFVHRNTLVYRLEKIQRITGLDLKNFDDAIVFKVAMMVKKYLDKSQDMLY